jgi:MFS family permease
MMIRDIKNQLNGGFSWRRTFTALQYPNYRLWFWGQMTSLFGTWMQGTAQSFLMFKLTNSTVYLGYVGFANGIPTWFFMLLAGVAADRMSRRNLMIITQTSMMIFAFITAALTFLHMIQPWHIILLAFGFGVANAFDAPARQAMVQELVPFEDMTNAIALNSTMFNMAVAAGPAVGGVTYGLFGPAWCFTINGLSFIAVIAALAAMKLKPLPIKSKRSPILTDVREGLAYVATHTLIRTIISLVALITLFAFSFVTLVPAWTVKILHGNAATNGLLLSLRGLGALVSALFIASLGRFSFKGRLLTLGSLAFPVSLIIFSFVRWLPLSLIVLFSAGFAHILFFNLANASVQMLTPNGLRGRVMSIYSLTFFGLMPFGALIIGWFASRVGEPEAIAITALITLLYTGSIAVFLPKLRRLS